MAQSFLSQDQTSSTINPPSKISHS